AGARGALEARLQLIAGLAVDAREEQRAVRGRQLPGVRACVAARVDVLDQGGAGGGAVGLPQLPPVRAVVGREEQRPVHGRQVAGGRTVDVVVAVIASGAARGDVLDA